MRKFNDREKEIIKKLCQISFSETEYFSYFLKTKYFIEQGNKALRILPKEKKAILYIKQAFYEDLKLRKKELGEFLELLSLIIYLKENRYINIFLNNEFKDSDEIRMYELENLDADFGGIEMDLGIFNSIKDNFFGLLYVSEELIQLSNNNFLSEDEARFNTQLIEDERKFKKQRCDTWISIGLSFLVGTSALIYQVYTEKLQEKDTQKVVDAQNIYFEKISNSLDSLKIYIKSSQNIEKDNLKDKK